MNLALNFPGGKTIEGPSGLGGGTLKFTPESKSVLSTIVSGLIPIFFVIALLLVLIKLIAAGFGYMTSSGDSKKVEKAQADLTQAIVGFFVVFTSFWLVQIVQKILGLNIL